MKVKALAPWFGGKRTMAPLIAVELGKHSLFFDLLCGSLSLLFAKEKSRQETVNDLHGDIINLARVIQDRTSAEALYDRLNRTLLCESLLEQAERLLEGELLSLENVLALGEKDPPVVYQQQIERAYWYFLACWMGRNGTAGVARQSYNLAVRWTAGGGDPGTRWISAVGSIPDWHERLRGVVILNRDGIELLDRVPDQEGVAVYLDPPYLAETRTNHDKSGTGGYRHDFKFEDHERLARALARFQKARVVLSYYDHPTIRGFYPGWTVVDHARQKNLFSAGARGDRQKTAPEILLINGPSLATGGVA